MWSRCFFTVLVSFFLSYFPIFVDDSLSAANAAPAATVASEGSDTGEDSDHISTDPRVAEARVLFGDGQFAEALEILRQIEFGRRNWMDIQFLRAMAAVELARRTEEKEAQTALLDEGVAAFRKILTANPKLTRVRLEMARALFLLQQDESAKEHFERVLASDVHANIKSNVQYFLSEIHARRGLKWHFGMGLTRDTNINSTSKDGVAKYPGSSQFSLREVRLDLPKVDSGLGVSVWTGFRYSKPESGRWVYTGDIFRTEYKGRNYDNMILSGSAGPRWFFDGGRKRLHVSATFRRDWSARDEPQFIEYGGRMQTTQFVRNDWQLVQSLSVTQRQFRKKFWSNTGSRLNLTSDAYHRLNATTQVNFGGGLAWSRPRNTRTRNRTYSLRMGVTRDFTKGITLGARLNLSKVAYWDNGGSFTKDLKKRTDKNGSFQILLNKRDFQIKGFSPQVVFSKNKLNSNALGRSYKRNLVELRLNRQL